jgi:hypothetical protein
MAEKSKPPFPQIAEVKATHRGENTEGLHNIQEYLVRFGYLSAGEYQADHLDEKTSEALTKYQAYHQLHINGEFDELTKDNMITARCAHPDLDNGLAFSTRCAWQGRALTFTFDTDTNDLAAGAAFQAVRNAFQTWANIIPVTFTEVNQNPDIRVGWRPANDPDLNMVGGTLAHADFPPNCSVITNTLPKPVHFDDTEHTWVIGAVSNGFDVETVALHEIGHIIGLQHSNVAGSVMFPTVSSNFIKRVLTADDILGARELYPSQWHHNDLTNASGGAPVAAGSPAGYMFDAQGTQHVVYRGTNNHIPLQQAAPQGTCSMLRARSMWSIEALITTSTNCGGTARGITLI